MNIVLADVQSIQPTPSDVAAQESQADDQFTTLIDQQLRQDIQLTSQAEFPQATEIEDIIDNAEEYLLQAEQSPKWISELNDQISSQPTELDSLQLSYILNKVDNPDSVETIEDIQPISIASSEIVLGDVLPLDGNSLPPLANQITMAPLYQETTQAIVPVTVSTVKLASMPTKSGLTAQHVNDSSVLDNLRAPTATESPVVVKAELSIEKLSTATGNDFQIANSTTTNTNEINSNLFRLYAQPAVFNNSQPQSVALPPQLESMSLANPRDQSALSSGLGDRIHWMVNQKLNAATIRIDPPMLGRLDVQIQLVDDATNVTINTQHAQTRDLIENASMRLREYLQENGYQNVNVDVSHQQQHQASDQTADSDTFEGDQNLSKQASDSADNIPANRYFSSDSVVDYFA